MQVKGHPQKMIPLVLVALVAMNCKQTETGFSASSVARKAPPSKPVVQESNPIQDPPTEPKIEIKAKLEIPGKVKLSSDDKASDRIEVDSQEQLSILWSSENAESCELNDSHGTKLGADTKGDAVYGVSKDSDVSLVCRAESQIINLMVAISLKEVQLPADNETVVCSQVQTQNINIDSGQLPSNGHEPAHPSAVPLWLSEVITFDLDQSSGNVVPITSYSQDDVVMMVPTGVRLDQLSYWNQNVRHIVIPEAAIFVYDGNRPNWAAGAVDDRGHTKYMYQGKELLYLPGGQIRQLKDIYQLAERSVAHNQVRLARLQDPAYFDAEKRLVSFRFLMVPHGTGHIKAAMEVKKCGE